MADSESPPILPLELCEIILHLVQELDEQEYRDYWDPNCSPDAKEPRRAILSCASVCRSWVFLTRSYTFTNIVLSPSEETWIAFGELVADPLCTFRTDVQALRLELNFDASPGVGTSWLKDALKHVALLPQVKDLAIFRGSFDAFTEDEWTAYVLPLFKPSIEQLDIDATGFPSVANVIAAVSCCVGLRRLALRWLRVDEQSESGTDAGTRQLLDADPTLAPLHAPSRFLESISLDHTIALSEPVLSWLCPRLLASSSAKRMRLVIDNVGVETSVIVAQFLHKAGPSVRSLDLGFQARAPYWTADKFCEAADLRTLVNIERLHFSQLAATEWMSTQDWLLDHIPFVLEQISQSRSGLTRLEFSFQAMYTTALSRVNWGRIMHMLNATHKFPRLEQVTFNVHSDVLEQFRPLLDDYVANMFRDGVDIEYHSMEGYVDGVIL